MAEIGKQNSRKILIAEDDPVSLRILETILSKWGYEVICATDGKEAWEEFQNDREIQIIISDWMMPNTDGPELCHLVRNAENRPYTYFILLTAKTMTEDIVQGMEAGADDFVTKPFNQNELRVRIRAGVRVVNLENQLEDKIDELTLAYDRIKSDLKAAAAIQQSMLPATDQNFPSLKYSWYYMPSSDLGGDLFNLVKLNETLSAIYIYDVSGHGVPAALQSVALGRFITPYDPHSSLLVKHKENNKPDLLIPPSEIIKMVNSRFRFAVSRGDFITLLYGIFDSAQRTFTFSRAGHPSPIHISGGKISDIGDEGGIPIGIIPDYPFVEHTIKLEHGDRLFFFTDGIIEAPNPEGRMFGEAAMRDYLQTTANLELNESLNSLLKEISTWQNGEEPSDDMSILAVETVFE
ncbi:MAG: SpoIIE family protein phosphatase [bacterium]